MAAEAFSFEANSAERELEEVSMISTEGKLERIQSRHWPLDWGWE